MPRAFARQLNQVVAAERILARAFMMVGERHRDEADVRTMTRTLSTWSNAHVAELAPFVRRYGRSLGAGEAPRRLRSELFHGVRVGDAGLLLDLADLGVLAGHVQQAWETLKHGGNALHDTELDRLCERSVDETWRQRSWLATRSRSASGQALLAPDGVAAKAKSLLPRSASIAALLDLWWTPVAAAVLIGAVGLVGASTGTAMLLPSLGPSAWLVAERPHHPAADWHAIVLGHLVAIGAGFAAVALVGAANDPSPLIDDALTGARVAASMIAIALCAAVLLPLKSSHPPAAATALLVSLGAVRGWRQAAALLAGAALLALVGEALRRLRMGRAAAGATHPTPGFGKEPPRVDPLGQPTARPSGA